MADKASPDVAVVGAGGHAKVVISLLEACGLRPSGVYDDDARKIGTTLLGVPVRGAISDLPDRESTLAVLAIGDNAVRRDIARAFRRARWIVGVHPAAWVHASVQLGAGTLVFAGAVIQPDAVLGGHVVVNTGAGIDHDCVVGDFAHLAPGVRLAGGVRVGAGTLVGIGAVAIPRVSIGAWARVGAGAAVISDVEAGTTVTGVPAGLRRYQITKKT